LTKPENKVLKDLSGREILVLSAVTLFIFWIGIYPQTFLSRMEPTVKGYLTQVNAKYQTELRILAGGEISPQSAQSPQNNMMAQK